MLTWIIVGMIAWPIVGLGLVSLAATYYIIRGMMIFGVDEVKLKEFNDFLLPKNSTTKFEFGKSKTVEVVREDGTTDKERRMNRLNNILLWPLPLLYLILRGNEAIRHFKELYKS